ncbi:MAG TPA: hypothetical protein VF941_20460, partial [Clostridia bacterium]
MFGCILLHIGFAREKIPAIKRQRLVNLILADLVSSFIVIKLFIAKAMGSRMYVEDNTIYILVSCIVLILLLIKFGALGIRIRLEHQTIGSSLDSISQGTAIFNHTLKNEVNKISLSSLNIKNIASSKEPDMQEILLNTRILENSSEYLRKIVNRLKSFSNEINIRESIVSLEKLIEETLIHISPYTKEKNLSIIKNCGYEIYFRGDNELLAEVLNNIF